jgi:hypothetical protein
MSEQIIGKYEELIKTGAQLLPQGGFEVSGYNARLQNKYLEWRKSCLETLELSGPIGFTYKQKVLNDAQGGFFYQPSVQLILNCIRELYEKLKAEPELASAPQAAASSAPSGVTSTETSGVRILKPPPKKTTASPVEAAKNQPDSQASMQTSKVYVVGEADDPLHVQLTQFLNEIGLEEIYIERQHAQMLPIDSLQVDAQIKYAFFVINPDDVAYAMFELGHFVGKLGKDRVCILHMSDVDFPKNIPGVIVKSIVVKLEEASFALLKDLKSAGYEIKF